MDRSISISRMEIRVQTSGHTSVAAELGVSEQHLEIRMEAFVMKRKTPGLPDPRNEVN
jgi:hypothetical protein